ncbi:MAG TPA: RNA polymerase sigma-70 factor [Dysgonomonas sp.]|nr:RNA polymerase sigma-70 factor [Dysgonomonas sp.]
MKSNHDKKELLEVLSKGDQNAFRHLFLDYFPKVKEFIAQFLKNEVIAEDLSQDIFVKIWENRKSLPLIHSFDAYIYRMAKNSALNQIKKESYNTIYQEYNNPISESFSIEEDIFAREIKLLIELTVSRMPEQRKRIYTMSRVDGLKNEEIANQLKISKKTVENHLNLALREIKKSITLLLLFFA